MLSMYSTASRIFFLSWESKASTAAEQGVWSSITAWVLPARSHQKRERQNIWSGLPSMESVAHGWKTIERSYRSVAVAEAAESK